MTRRPRRKRLSRAPGTTIMGSHGLLTSAPASTLPSLLMAVVQSRFSTKWTSSQSRGPSVLSPDRTHSARTPSSTMSLMAGSGPLNTVAPFRRALLTPLHQTTSASMLGKCVRFTSLTTGRARIVQRTRTVTQISKTEQV